MPDQHPHKRWLADFDVLSDYVMPAKAPTFAYSHPAGLYEAHLSNESDKNADHTLRLRLIVHAASVHSVPELAEELANKFLHVLAFLTQGTFRIERIKKVIEWTAGVAMREMLLYTHVPQQKVIGQLVPAFFKSVELLHKVGVSEISARALRWYAAGIRASRMEDQFQYFWFVVELSAAADSQNEKVADKCQKCRGELYCPKCEEVSKHRPFQTQRIWGMFEEVELPEDKIIAMFEARNRLMHGASRDELEAYAITVFPEKGFQAFVDTLAQAAHSTIATTLPREKIAHEGLVVAGVTTYVATKMSIAAHVKTTMPGDDNNPSIDQIDNLGVKVGFASKGEGEAAIKGGP